MSVDIEEILGRELREVADAVRVPALPALPREQARPRHWQALLVAAVVLLIVACAVAMEAISGGSREPSPAPPSPSPSRVGISTSPSTATYELNRKVYAGGEQAPGSWVWFAGVGDSWVGWRDDLTWWRGLGTQIDRIEDVNHRAPALSPNGEYIGAVLGTSGEGDLVGFETRRGGEGLGGTPIELGDPDAGNSTRVRAVLDDGRIIAQGASAAILWLPLRDVDNTVDLSRTAPGQEVRYNTSAGLVVTDGLGGSPYLAEISDAGRLTSLRDLPSNNAVFSPGAVWFAWTPSAPQGGDVMRVPTLQVQSLDDADEVEWTAPAGWDFRVGEWTWEDDDLLVAPVAQDDGPYGERIARCSVRAARCVLIDSP
jgi:hypothetical protein